MPFQIRDVTTSSRMTTLGSKARRLQITVLQQLEDHRTELLYQLTAFDLQKSYWEATLNKSIENLKFARNFFHQHSERIFEGKSQQFREKFVNAFYVSRALYFVVILLLLHPKLSRVCICVWVAENPI